ncbi:YetF domain-containing protein [Novosphingobium sp. PS1R-30]|uniref:YetF domain-containing protein n=1 Tax=Novosphingobium anseongense TaxID=3133436 RepID=A0ABU8RQC2_9SPHN
MEIVLRASVMFLVVYGLLRLMGKRELGQLAPFELVTLIVMGDLIQQGVTHQDFSATGATLAIFTFAAWSLAFNALSHRSGRVRRVLEGAPVVLMQDGAMIERNLNREGIDKDEFAAEMRLAGIARPDQVAWAILEPQGRISFIRKDDGDPDPRGGEETSAA